MILCGLNDVPADAILGSSVTDPHRPTNELLRPGIPLDQALLASLKKRGVVQLWIQDDLTKDLDAAVAPGLAAARMELYTRLRDGLAAAAGSAISAGSIQEYRAAALEMVTEAISSAKYASMTDALFGTPGQASHGTNVAYLSLLCGLHIQQYIASQQPRLDPKLGRELSILGLAGMLHDIGKSALPAKAAAFRDVHATENGGTAARPERYLEHVSLGKAMLENSRAPARVAHAVLNHHQRFDGKGWPDLTNHTAGRVQGALAGRRIHIFARIVSAANVLDNLLSDADGAKRPPVVALHEFASEKYDGWFDPIVRRAMLLRVPPFAIGTDIKLSDGRRAVVVAPTAEDPCRPIVRTIAPRDARNKPSPADEFGSDRAQYQTIDLHAVPGLSITHALGVDVSRYIYAVPARIPMEDGPEAKPVAAAA